MHLSKNTRNCIDFITFMQDYPGVDYHHQHQDPHQTDGDGAGERGGGKMIKRCKHQHNSD